VGQGAGRRAQAGGTGARNQGPLRRCSDLGRARGRMGRRFSWIRPSSVDSDAAIHDCAGHARRHPDQCVEREAGSTSGLSASLRRRRRQACGKRTVRIGKEKNMGEHDQTLDKDAYRSIHDDGRKLPPIRREEYFHQYDDYANPIPGSEYLPTYAHQAFLFSRKELIPEIVYVHGDKFTPTEWEAQFSDLTGSGDEQSFVPVVDDNFRVVGHLGWIDGKNICVPKKTIAEGYGYPYAAELEKARLFGVHRRLVSIHYSIVDSRLPGFPGQPVSAAPTKRPAPCWPANKPPSEPERRGSTLELSPRSSGQRCIGRTETLGKPELLSRRRRQRDRRL